MKIESECHPATGNGHGYKNPAEVKKPFSCRLKPKTIQLIKNLSVKYCKSQAAIIEDAISYFARI